MAFDVLSFVMGQQAGKSAGSSVGGENFDFCSDTAKLTGTWNETVSVNFGFLPDMLILAPEYANYTSDVSPGDKNCIFIGVRSEIASKFGAYIGDINKYYYRTSAGKVYTLTFSGIDSTDSNNAINNVSKNGFTFGKTHPSGTYRITALKFT